MNAIILVGGDQTRFGKTFAEQPKVLLKLPSGEMLLSHTLHQLDEVGDLDIILAIRDKELFAGYIKSIDIKKPILIDRREHRGIGEYFFISKNYLPATYIFGDVYFRQSALTTYFKEIKIKSGYKFDGIIGICRHPVGDYRVEVDGDQVKTILRESGGEYFTCGIFTVLNPELGSMLEKREKLTDIISQLCCPPYRLGYVIIEERLVDLDTEDKLKGL